MILWIASQQTLIIRNQRLELGTIDPKPVGESDAIHAQHIQIEEKTGLLGSIHMAIG